MRDPLDGTITRVDMTRTAENIQRTTQHELEHVESWREFHDEWAPRFEAITSEYYAGQPDECADLQQRYQALLNEYVSAHAEHVEHNDHHHEFSGDIRTGVNLQTGEEVITGTY